MKRLILFELIVLFLATTFESDSPPGWFQQTLPVNDFINDIFFLDSSTGWVVTDGEDNPPDTGYVMKTINGGINWEIQFNIIDKIQAVCFTDNNTGYIAGGTGNSRLFKSTDGGNNWNNINFKSFGRYEDLYFINNNTGWICDANSIDGGLWITTNGGLNWQQQLGATSFPKKLFFLNQDTGWVICQNTKLLRTTNAGLNWDQQNDFGGQINDVFFRNGNLGCVSGGINYRTTDGGLNWLVSNDGGVKLSFANDSIGWAGNNFSIIMKTTTGGQTWFRQSSPIFNAFSTDAKDTNLAWAGGSGIVKTTDGGGPPVGIQQINSEIPSDYKLYQNYPNPFNPVTNIRYSVMPNVKAQMSNIKLIIYDVQGKAITTLVNEEQKPGMYEADWNASAYPSGVYFYSLVIEGLTVETRKMILIK